MSLIQKAIAAQSANPSKREVEYGILMSYTGCAPAIVNGEPKARIIANVLLEGVVLPFYMFRESVYGLPNYIPKGGVQCQITVQLNIDDEGKEHVNAVALGVDAVQIQKAA